MRQGAKGGGEQEEREEDIKFLLSNVRARENGLVFFLQLFSMAARSRIQTQQYKVYKQQFLMKQKIYSSQIRQLIDKLATVSFNSIQLRSFWMRLKSILRVSLERARLMAMLTQSLAYKFEEVMTLINIAHEQSFQMREYLRVEAMLKKRTVEAMVAAKHLIFENAGVTDSLQGVKIRSQTILKASIKPTQSVNLSPNQPKISNNRQEHEGVTINKLKSITRVKKKGEKVRVRINQIKKSQLAWNRYQTAIGDLMNCKTEVLDKKKSRSENQERIYDQLFNRNINNHKAIIKYSHNVSKLKQIMAQAHKATKKRLVSQKKFNQGVRQQIQPVSDKNMLGRANTSKKNKTGNVRIQSGHSQKVSELLKGAL